MPDNSYGHLTTCQFCGKELWISDTTQWIFKRELHYLTERNTPSSRTVFYCSYTCYRAEEKPKTKNKKTWQRLDTCPVTKNLAPIKQFADRPNYDLRQYAHERSVPLGQVVKQLHISNPTITNWLNNTALPREKKERFKQAVDDIVKARDFKMRGGE